MNNLINRKACKEMALKQVENHRKGWDAERVSKQFLDDLNTKVILLIQSSIKKHPTIGKTIKYF